MGKFTLALPSLSVMCALSLLCLPASALAQTVPAEATQAALAGDWNTVWTTLGGEKTNPQSAEQRLIKGHACLALNHNNQSLELFASALNDADRQAWQAWAHAFAQDRQDNAIASYFQGDAHARLKEWDAAAQCFDRALDLDPNCYLALNARGVVAHAVGNTMLARTFFVKASKAKADFADAYASRGTLGVFLNRVQGRKDFMAARSRSHDENPILPIIGLGCTHYGEGDYEQARSHFDIVPEASAMSSLARNNRLAAELDTLTRAVQDAARNGMFINSLQIPLDGNTAVDVQTTQPLVGTVFARWGITGIDIDLGFPPRIRIKLGPLPPPGPLPDPPPGPTPDPPPGGGGNGGNGGQPGGETGHASVIQELIPEFPATSLLAPLTNVYRPSPESPNVQDINVPSVVRAIQRATVVARQNVSAMDRASSARSSSTGNEGGANADPTKVPVNRGNWSVCNVYGLLYSVPANSRTTQAPRSED